MPAEQPPNILMIVLDQLRFDSLGHTSGGQVRTPHIDALADTGVRFDNAFNHLPTCCPSRQSLLNGRRPEAFGAHWNFDIALPVASLTPADPTWPARLTERGYRSTYLGKWHVSPDFDPTDFGYDDYVSQVEYETYRSARYPDLASDHEWSPGADLGTVFGPGIDPVDLVDAETHWFAGLAADRIREYSADARPWHVRLDLVQPHLPCRPVAEFADRYDAEDIAPWPSFAEDFAGKPYIQAQQLQSWQVEHWTWQDWAPIVAGYFAIIEQVDDAIGLVLESLRQSGQEGRTVVIFTTDHGDMGGGHRMMDKHYVLYDDVIHVPLIVSWPGVIAPGVRDEMTYNVLDLVPTITELMATEALPDTVGRSLLPLMDGSGVDMPWRTATVSTFNGQQFGLYTQRAIRTAEWKYIWNATDVDELYDLVDDPSELRNVVHEPANAEVLGSLRHELYETLLVEGDRQVDNPWVRNQLVGGRIL